MTLQRSFLALSLASLMSFAACTKKVSEAPQSAARTTESAPATAATPAAAAAPVDANAKADVELQIGSKGDEIAFDKTELKVKAGQTVKLTFKNNAKSGGVQHNWVLVQPGTETAVANEGMQAGDAGGWVKAGPNVIAHTALARNPGEEVTVTFKAPAAGKYPYICTFPGHAVAMKGTLVVE
jgi:azurin